MNLQKKIDQSRYRGMTRNIVVFMVAVAVIPLILTGGITLLSFSGAYEDKVYDHLRELGQKHAQNIGTFLSDRLAEVRVMTRSFTIEQLKDKAFLRERLALLREEYRGEFVDLGLVDEKGIQVNYVGPFNLAMADYSQAEWFKNALDSDRFISDVFTGLRGTPHFIVTVKKMYGAKQYLVKATIDFYTFNRLVENISIGRTGFAFLFNREAEFQTKPRFPVNLGLPPYSKLLKGGIDIKHNPVVAGKDSNGKDALFALASLKGEDWFLALEQQTADAYSNLYNTVLWALAAILISAAAILVLGLSLAGRLVGRIKQADEKQAVLNEKVIETGKLASIGELAAGIAHEINNPVAIMVEEAGWIEDILTEDKPMEEEDLVEIERAVQQIRAQGGRCKDITYKLLSFARKTDPAVKPVSINSLVAEVVGLLSQKSRFASVQIDTSLAPGLPDIPASPSELQQVILNLVNNAVDAMGSRGGVVEVSTRQEEGFIRMIVSDNGEGIPESNLPRIFDPFFTTKPVGRGTGLGLSICYGIVKKMDGEISVKSRMGEGTVFTILLPASEPESEKPKATVAQSLTHRKGEEVGGNQ